VPAAKDAVQVGAHVIPAGLLVTVPVEVPANVTVSWYDVVAGTGLETDDSDCADAMPELPRNNPAVTMATTMATRREKEFRIKLDL
jgi:hypothetical protein